MNIFTRRRAIAAIAGAGATGLGLLSRRTNAQGNASTGGGHGLFSHLNEPGLHGLPEDAPSQHVFDSPAPAGTPFGEWTTLPPMPLPRSEMAWATSWEGRLHIIGGYGDQRVDTAYHHVFIAAEGRWFEGAPVPRGGNHLGVVATQGLLYAIGGHGNQNRSPYADCFVYNIVADTWSPVAPLPRARGAISVVELGAKIHAIGGAIGDSNETKRSVDWHEVYDPATDKWEPRAPLPQGRDHMGAVAVDGRIHVIAGRVDSAAHNVARHDVYLSGEDRWEARAPLPTARSGHGAVLYRGKIFVMGGEEFRIVMQGGGRRLTGKVFGQNEAYDPTTDSWRHHAPMPTPRHGLGAAVVGDAIHVAGGGPVVGGRVQSAVHEAFTLG